MNELLEPINIAFFVVCVLVCTSTIVLGREGREWIKSETARKKLGLVQDVVETAIYHAEQLGFTQRIDNKKAVALAYAEEKLKKLGVEVDLPTLTAEIEAAVLRHFPKIRY
jgi:hypothetical protein